MAKPSVLDKYRTDSSAPSETEVPVSSPPSSAGATVSEARPSGGVLDRYRQGSAPAEPQEPSLASGVIGKEDYFDRSVDDLPKELQGSFDMLPMFRVEKAQTGFLGLGEGQSAPYAGKLAIDKAKLRQELADARLAAWRVQYVASNGTEPSPEETFAQREHELEVAKEKTNELEAHRRGKDHLELWVDMDQEDSAYWIRKQAEAGPIGRLTAPFRASLGGIDVAYAGPATPETVSYNENSFLGMLDWTGRNSLFTLMGTAAVAAGLGEREATVGEMAKLAAGGAVVDFGKMLGAWGSPQHLELISQGHDLFSLTEELGVEDKLQALGMSEGWAKGSAQLAAFGLSIFDPDMLLLASAPKGALKLASAASEALGTTDKALDILEPVTRKAGIDTRATAARRESMLDSGVTLQEENLTGLSADLREIAEADELRNQALLAGQDVTPKTGAVDHAQNIRVRSAERIQAVREYFRKKGPEGEAMWHTIVRNTQARIGKTAAVGKESMRAVVQAAKSRRKLGDMLDEAADAMARSDAAVAAARKASKRKNAKAVNAAVDQQVYDVARHEHMSLAMATEDVRTHLKAISLASQGLDDLKPLTDAQKVAAAQEMRDAVRALQDARDAMLTQPSTATGQAWADARDHFRQVSLTAMNEHAATAKADLEDLLQSMETATKAKFTALEDAYKGLRKRRYKGAANAQRRADLDKQWAVHKGQLKKMTGKASEVRAAEEVNVALLHTMRRMQEGYRHAAAGTEAAEDAATLFTETQRNIRSAYHSTWGTNPVRALTRALTDVTNPALSKYGVEPEAVQESITQGLASVRRAEKEMASGLEGLDPKAQKSWLLQYISSSASLGDGILYNTLGDRAVWSRALPALRSQAAKALSKDGGSDHSTLALRTLAKAFIGGGADAPGTRGAADQMVKAIAKAITKAPAGRPPSYGDILAVAQKQASGVADGADLSTKSHMMAAMAVVQAATIGKVGQRIVAEVGQVTPEQARLAESFIFNPGKAGEHYTEIAKIFNKMGIPTAVTKRVQSTNDRLDNGVSAIVDDYSGTASFVPWSFLEEMASNYGRLEKTSDPWKEAPSDAVLAIAGNGHSRLMRLYSSSLVTGLVLPRPRHYANILVGNFAQTWYTDELWAATKLQGRTLVMETANMSGFVARKAAGVVGLEKRMDDALLMARRKMMDTLGTNNVLPDALHALYNPHVSGFFDTKLWPNSTKVKTVDGEVTLGEIRKWAEEHGVLSSFVDSTGLRDAIARSPNIRKVEEWLNTINRPAQWAGKKALGVVEGTVGGKYGAYHAEVADLVEQRQRVAYFVDLVTNRGLDPVTASQKVKDALYDWNSVLPTIEKKISRYLLFWGFQRRAMAQAASGIMRSFDASPMASSSGLAKLAGVETTPLARLQEMHQATKAAKQFGRDDEYEDPELARVLPWWASRAANKQFLTNTEISDHEREAWKEYGQSYTHSTATLPAFTPLEMTQWWVESVHEVLLPLVELGMGADKPSPYEFPVQIGQGLGAVALKMGAESGGPAVEPAFEGMYEAFIRGENKYDTKGMKVKRLYDRQVFEHAPYLAANSWPTEDGEMRTTPGAMMAYRFATPLSYEIANWVEPVMVGGAIKETWGGAFKHIASSWSGIFQPYYHDPAKTLEYDQDVIKREIRAETREHEKRAGIKKKKGGRKKKKKHSLFD